MQKYVEKDKAKQRELKPYFFYTGLDRNGGFGWGKGLHQQAL